MKKLLLFILIISISASLFGCVKNVSDDLTKNANDLPGITGTLAGANDGDSFNNSEKQIPADGSKTQDTKKNEPGIMGYVVDKENGRILVVSSEAQDFSSNGGVSEFYEAIWFSNAPDDINIGDKVSVWFNIVLESYPGQSEIQDIKVIPGEKPEGANLNESEALYRALTSTEMDFTFFPVVKSIEYNNASKEWTIQLKNAHGDKIQSIIIKDVIESRN